jgi:hypothetical protein
MSLVSHEIVCERRNRHPTINNYFREAVTLATDAGTLHFSSRKDSISSSNFFSLDPLVQNLASPRRDGRVGGAIEEWGVAFDGLLLDSRLYLAVGLYQRDDRVTLLTVKSSGRSSNRDSYVDLSLHTGAG